MGRAHELPGPLTTQKYLPKTPYPHPMTHYQNIHPAFLVEDLEQAVRFYVDGSFVFGALKRSGLGPDKNVVAVIDAAV